MCSGRVDLRFVLRAFLKGMDGVFIGGCHLNECNYITHGNFDALNMILLCKKIMERIGLNPERLRIEFMSGGEGHLFAEVVNSFGKKIKEVGPLGQSEGLDKKTLQFRLEAVNQLVPYLKLVESQRMKASTKSEEAYRSFFSSEEVDRIFDELVGDKLAITHILLLLRDQPQSTGAISKKLSMTPSEVSKYIKSSSRQGLVRYDMDSKCYELAAAG